VAKRRNLKKEKASRNQAYARQFRKKTTRGGNFRGRNSYGAKKRDGMDDDKDTQDIKDYND
jgi:hypothetical protein